MENKDKIILDLCGGTGSWSRPYKEAGYDVRLITLPEYDVRTYQPPENVYGILAAPPCTEFSIAKGSRPRDFAGGMEIVEACLRIIWRCRMTGSLKFWAMENPVGFLRQFLGVPAYQFEQWQFGDPGVKPTDIWGYFRAPRKTAREMPDGITKRYSSGKVNTLACAALKPPEWVDASKLTRADLRAITPPGFAQAFFRANR